MTNHATTSTKLRIPHPAEPDCAIVGILEQLSPSSPTSGRKLALILHGTMGHKDYLFQKRLALKLPLDSFRFDFRGNHETSGTWRQGAMEEDLIDLKVVVDYLKSTYGYVVDLVVGHSRGSMTAIRWICTTEEGRSISAFVNASGRYRMHKILGNFSAHLLSSSSQSLLSPTTESPAAAAWKASFKKRGYYDWKVTVAKKPVTVKIFPEDLENTTKWDTSIVWDQFPPNVDVLTLHGLADSSVPPYDAMIFTRAFSGRTPGTHVLNMIEDADHNYTGHQDEVVSAILDWWAARERGGLKTSVWVEQEALRARL